MTESVTIPCPECGAQMRVLIVTGASAVHCRKCGAWFPTEASEPPKMGHMPIESPRERGRYALRDMYDKRGAQKRRQVGNYSKHVR